jgi:hypothetical protein
LVCGLSGASGAMKASEWPSYAVPPEAPRLGGPAMPSRMSTNFLVSACWRALRARVQLPALATVRRDGKIN